MSMRAQFVDATIEALEADPRVVVVLADISVDAFARVPHRHRDRIVNVGIREQALVSVAGGLALEGLRPVVHTYAPFLVERPFEQVKLDLGHQGVGAVLVSVGASYDASDSGRTHHSPGDVALIATIPGFEIQVPGHEAEAASIVRDAIASAGNVYVRLSVEENSTAHEPGFSVVRTGTPGAPVILAIGPALDATLDAVAEIDATVAYTTRVRPFPTRELAGIVDCDVVLVEPYLAGTSAAEVSAALVTRPHRLLAIGITEPELRRYGTPAEHRRAHRLDAQGMREQIDTFLGTRTLAAV